MEKIFLKILFLITIMGGLINNTIAAKGQLSAWMSKDRIMVIYNTSHMDSIAKDEAKTFSKDMGAWYMKQYGMSTKHLFGYDMGKKVYWDNPGAFDFLQAVADYIKVNKIQVVLMAPGTPLFVRDTNKLHNLCLDSLAGHALWFANVKKEAPTCTAKRSVAPEDSNLYFPYMDMKDGASPFVVRTKDAKRWIPSGKDLMIRERQWYDTMMKDLRDHPSVRPYGRIGMPYYLEAMGTPRLKRPQKGAVLGKNGKPIREAWSAEKLKIMDMPKESSKFVKDLVLGGFASRTSIEEFNKQKERCLLFFGREGNTASYIDVESSISEAMALDAVMQGIKPKRIVRVKSQRGWRDTCPLKEPKWDYTYKEFMSGTIKPGINPLIFSAGGVNNTMEMVKPWAGSLDVQPGMVAAVSVSNGKAFAGSLLRRGATTMIVNLHHPQNARLHAWFSVFRQLISGATVAEAMITSGGSERGGYVTGSIWGDPLYAPFGNNKKKTYWITGRKK